MLSPKHSNEPVLKRRRVTRACQNCRSQKSKCDGRPPVCSRCEGYGHICIWSDDKKGPSRGVSSPTAGVTSEEAQSLFPDQTSSQLYLAIQSYEKLITSLRPDLCEAKCAAVDLSLSHIRRRLPTKVGGPGAARDVPTMPSLPEPRSQPESTERNSNRQRYLGEASDVRFFHTIKQVLRDEDLSRSVAENSMQSYDQEIHHLGRKDEQGTYTGLPNRELADNYVSIYFATIHIAYPFIHRLDFMSHYERFWKEDLDITKNSAWLSLMYTVFAIGAYYTSFPRSEHSDLETHFQCFAQAVSLCSGSIMTDSTLESVQMLLAQCFFLLATGQTDRCWNTLGLAIRVAQAIGIHVEDAGKQPSATGLALGEQETVRRTWYSLYVLDRLLALQLGRPIAIHEEEYCVLTPSDADGVSPLDAGTPTASINEGVRSIDYFVHVIKFSQILGEVISDLYRPSQVEIDPDRMLVSTTTLDLKLIEWRLALPRHLRFDLGHTFEKSVTFRRQRNMLAIKFHHLRTLMHRPYLCLVYLQRNNRALIALLEREHDRVETLERICVSEAQQTAHLLHNVADERSLVHDFPWWQMISCLLCASSVLLVARSCIEPNGTNADVQSHALDEDAETCLKVFDALSTNSDSAGRARDMMRGLKRTRILPKVSVLDAESRSIYQSATDNARNTHDSSPMNKIFDNGEDQTFNYNLRQQMQEWETWQGEFSDPMAWSAQFVDPSQYLHSNATPNGWT